MWNLFNIMQVIYDAIICVIRFMSYDKFYLEPGVNSLKSSRWLRKLCLIKYLMNNHQLIYLVKFYRNPQTIVPPQAVTIVKFLFL